MSRFFGSIIGQIILFGYNFALMLHLFGGLRHAVWETGKGFEAGTRDALAWGSLIGAAVCTALAWAITYLLLR